MHATCSTSPIPRVGANNIWRKVQAFNLLTAQRTPPHVTSPFLGSNVVLRTLFPNIRFCIPASG
jgi:hypothetical protein